MTLQCVGRFCIRVSPLFCLRSLTSIHVPAARNRNIFLGRCTLLQIRNSSTTHLPKNLSTSTTVSQRMGQAKTESEIVIDIRKEAGDVRIKWPDGEICSFASIWLKHNCHCTQCKQDHSGQRLVDSSEIDLKAVPSEVKITDNGCLHVSWSGTLQHNTTIPLNWLKQNNYSEKNREWNGRMRRIQPLKGEIPSYSYADILKNEESLFSWICDINEHGLAMVKDVPREKNQVAKVAELIAPVQRTIYGKVFDIVSVQKPINIAYTPTKLGFHMDLVYYESPPGLQLLHALRFDQEVKGGESLFLDAHYMAEVLREKYPQHFETLVRVPASFQKIHFDREWPVYMQYQRPHIVVNVHKEITCVTWAPAFEGPLQVTEDDVKPYYKAYHVFAQLLEESHLKLKHRLQPGECIVFNNRRMLHAREAFSQDSGSRHLQGCYVNIDEFKTKVQVMMALRGTGQLSKRVGNQCFL
ncbi:gamma-butyrobetaine dioxygenase-like [Glandiceps talaboti]